MIPVILSGGSGTRLWPMSRTKLPKQFCNIFEESLQTLTLKRSMRLGTPWILTSTGLRDLTERTVRQLELKDTTVLYEPQAKNTAPAIAYLCRLLMIQGKSEEIVGIFPADQLIENEDEFIKAVALSEKEANKGHVVTLGIQPEFAHTGYGYIQTLESTTTAEAGLQSHPVVRFHEKPRREKAEEFLKAGGHYWNAGIFIFKCKTMIDLFQQHEPELWKAAMELKEDLSNLTEVYNHFRNISIDYAVMEKLDSKSLRCVPCQVGWSDVGSWDAVSDFKSESTEPVLRIDVRSEGNFLQPVPEKTYAFVGVEDLLIVDTKDALLISKKGESQDVKEVVEKLKALRPNVLNEHIFEDRPWGRYEVLKNTDHFKSKVIHVNPKAQISYQSHSKREEHWLVTQGKGEVILNESVIPVQPGTYVKIPLGAKHRIRNTGKDVVEFIEVQLGTYFGEDDIVRYQDDYKRV